MSDAQMLWQTHSPSTFCPPTTDLRAQMYCSTICCIELRLSCALHPQKGRGWGWRSVVTELGCWGADFLFCQRNPGAICSPSGSCPFVTRWQYSLVHHIFSGCRILGAGIISYGRKLTLHESLSCDGNQSDKHKHRQCLVRMCSISAAM